MGASKPSIKSSRRESQAFLIDLNTARGISQKIIPSTKKPCNFSALFKLGIVLSKIVNY
jgi:hypothetical protein